MLVLTRHLHERILIGDNIIVEVTAINPGTVRIGIEAPLEVPIHRQEVRDAILTGKPKEQSAEK